MTRNLTLAALGCLMLVSCGTPQEQCITRNTREYRTVANLLTEVEGNLARGYAWEERTVWRPEFGQCRYVVRDKDGNPHVAYRGCWRDAPETERYRVPIDPSVETRKAESLRERLKALTPGAEAAVRACRAAHPEQG
ncbi:hypothetical protein [Paracoccus alkenifer]|uniref:Uncharacterized protein n=1 Tax=Paracoccus alkenifer TaxID=65735 RepID=A0A1H6JVX0_9RHOB|nr:hypothetical protein [Paracoccus alkenifer]SEH66520.1 hypothetical protein SAMN04488075_0662 [Paracoccus alkenifer]